MLSSLRIISMIHGKSNWLDLNIHTHTHRHTHARYVSNVLKRKEKLSTLRSDEPADSRHEGKMAKKRNHRTLRSDEPTARQD